MHVVRKILNCFILLFLFYNACNAQKNKYLNYYITEVKFTYNKPTDFLEVYPDTTYFSGAWIMPFAPFEYELQSSTDDISICMSMMNLKLISDSINRLFDPKADKNTSYLRLIHFAADTINGKIIFLPKNYVKTFLHADDAIMYKVNMSITKPGTEKYRNKYDSCKEVLIHKNDRADIMIYYWYNESSAAKIDECIEKTKAMLIFKE